MMKKKVEELVEAMTNKEIEFNAVIALIEDLYFGEDEQMAFWIRKDEPKQTKKSTSKKAEKKPKKQESGVCYRGVCATFDILEAELMEMKEKAKTTKEKALLKKLEGRLYTLYEEFQMTRKKPTAKPCKSGSRHGIVVIILAHFYMFSSFPSVLDGNA